MPSDYINYSEYLAFKPQECPTNENVRQEPTTVSCKDEEVEKHFNKIIKKYEDQGLKVNPIDVDQEPDEGNNLFMIVEINIDDRFYLKAQADNEQEKLYGWHIKDREATTNLKLFEAPEQIKDFIKRYKGE